MMTWMNGNCIFMSSFAKIKVQKQIKVTFL